MYASPDPPNRFENATTYNNFYEFGVEKGDPARLAKSLRTRPWTVEVGGLVHKPRTFDIDEFARLAPLEERVHAALRRMEAWSMVIPYIGYPLSAVLKYVEPTGQAKYVGFTTFLDPEQFPGQKRGFFGFTLDWPVRSRRAEATTGGGEPRAERRRDPRREPGRERPPDPQRKSRNK